MYPVIIPLHVVYVLWVIYVLLNVQNEAIKKKKNS